MSFKNSVFLVTAASRGMGAAIAKELALNQASLVLMSRSEAILSLADSLGAVPVLGSTENAEDLKKCVDLAMEKFGRIDGVVNNTGHPPKGDLLEISDTDWMKGMNQVLMNVIRISRLVTPVMINQKKGAIVNISTFSAFEPSASFPVSSTFRAALGSYMKLYADRYGSSNIRMNNVLPGFIDTYAITEDIKKQIPLNRSGKTNEIAKTVAFLLSDDAGYITGQNIRVDGGITRSI